jgi:uncharacterized membrane protein YfhO
VRSESGFGILTRPPTRRAFVVHRTVVAANLDEALSYLRSMKTFEEAVVWKGAPLLTDPTSTASSADLRRPSPERMDISVQSDRPGLLVVSEHYDPGWRAQVDGRDVRVHPADVIAIGVEVPEGRHEVRLRFVPVGFVPGVACAASTALVLGGLALTLRARARSKPRP